MSPIDVKRTLPNRSGGRCNSRERSFHWGLVVSAVPLDAAIRQQASKRSAAFQQRPHRPRRAPHRLARCTLYTSAEPCATWAGAIYLAGIGRVVYGQSEKALKEQIGAHEENPTLDLPAASNSPLVNGRPLRDLGISTY